MPRREKDDPALRELKARACKKLLVDARNCIKRSRDLVEGSRTLIESSRRLKNKKTEDGAA